MELGANASLDFRRAAYDFSRSHLSDVAASGGDDGGGVLAHGFLFGLLADQV